MIPLRSALSNYCILYILATEISLLQWAFPFDELSNSPFIEDILLSRSFTVIVLLERLRFRLNGRL